MEKKIYQPQGKKTKETPEGLFSWQVFSTRENAEKWLKEHIYTDDEYEIVEYNEDDIEDYTLVEDREKTYNLYCHWEEDQKGSSDGYSADTNFIASFKTREMAERALKESMEKGKEDLKNEVKFYGYSYKAKYLTIDGNKLTYIDTYLYLSYQYYIKENYLN